MKPMDKTYTIEEPENRFVEEAPTVYYSGKQTIPLNILTSMEKMEISKRGISKKYLESFKKKTSLDYYTLADALSVTRATLINKKGEQKFNDQVSERIVSLADLYAYGYEVFGNPEKFNHWMMQPNQALGGLKPLAIIDSIYGREEVKNIIGRIAYGVYS